MIVGGAPRCLLRPCRKGCRSDGESIISLYFQKEKEPSELPRSQRRKKKLELHLVRGSISRLVFQCRYRLFTTPNLRPKTGKSIRKMPANILNHLFSNFTSKIKCAPGIGRTDQNPQLDRLLIRFRHLNPFHLPVPLLRFF